MNLKKNKTVIFAAIIVIISGIMVGAIIKFKSGTNTSFTPEPQVEGALTQINTPVPTPNITATNIPLPTSTPIPHMTKSPIATASPTTNPTVSPTPTPTSTATPTYNATITNVSSNGNLSANITVNVTNNNVSDGGEIVTLSANADLSFDPSYKVADSNGNATFVATSTQAGSYNVIPQVYNISYGTGSSVTFASQ